MSHHRLAAQGLRFSYPGGPEVLKGVDFEIRHGESVALVGANGAGKTTLLSLLNGVLAHNCGKIVVGDLVLGPAALVHARRTVGTVFQDPEDQLFMPTVYEDVAFGPMNLGMAPEDCLELAQSCLERVGAWHLKDRPPHHLSGGEKRRVAIAAVLAMSPDILLLDEPTTGLDPKGRRQVIDLLNGFTHSKLVVSHDLEMVLDMCPRTIMLCDGVVIADGPSESLLKDEVLLERTGLEKPESLKPCAVCGHIGRAKS